MGKVTVGEETTTPAAPSAGFTLYSTLATPTVPSLITKAGAISPLVLLSASGTWTPGVTFGGGNTGLTFSPAVQGRYYRFLNTIIANGYMQLSNKGSSTGTALITGLPVAATAAMAFQPAIITWGNLTGITGMVEAYVAASGTTLSLQYLGTGSPVALTDAHFTNTTYVILNIVYEV